jgi:hypothetical protein
MGFKTTPDGREYTLRVDGSGDPRFFTVVIAHAVFASRQARFQDAPDLCFAKLQRELTANAELPQGSQVVVTTADLADYREAQNRRSPDRKAKATRAWP